MIIHPTSSSNEFRGEKKGRGCWISISSMVNQVPINTVDKSRILGFSSAPPPLDPRQPFGEAQLVEVTEADARLPAGASQVFRIYN